MSIKYKKQMKYYIGHDFVNSSFKFEKHVYVFIQLSHLALCSLIKISYLEELGT